MKDKKHTYLFLLIYIALIVLSILAFEPVRHNDFISYDSYAYVTENPQVRGGITRESIIWAFSTAYKANWHPLTWLSHMLDCELFGLNPTGHHLVNLLLHIANTLLLFWVFKRMSGAIWPSAFTAVIFALHPLHVESVVWVAERKDLLSGLFFMFTIAAYIRYVEHPGIRRYLLIVLTLALGLMSKPMLVTMPFVLLLLDYWPLGRLQWEHNRARQDTPNCQSLKYSDQRFSVWYLIIEKIPLFVLVVISSVITCISQQTAGAMLSVQKLAFSFRVANSFISYITYIRKMFYPSRLAIFYPHPVNKLLSWQPIICLVILILASAAIIYASRRRRYLAMGWLWYLGTLLPVIGLVQVGSQAMADRYTYLPLIGIFIMIAWGIAKPASKWRYRSIWLGIPTALLIVAMIICTRMQVQRWKNNLTLYRYTLDVTKDNAIMRNSYGHALFEKDRLDEAITQLSKAMQVSPKFILARASIGKIFFKQGKINEAIACFNEVLRTHKDWPDVYYYLGLAEVQQEKYNDAVTHFAKALQLEQGNIKTRLQLAYALTELDRIQQAIEHFYKILQLKPDHPQALNAAAWLLATAGDSKLRNPTDAVEFAEKACELTNYIDSGALDTLAAAYAAAGRFNKAVETIEKAIERAIADGSAELTQQFQNRLQLYKTNQPYYEYSTGSADQRDGE